MEARTPAPTLDIAALHRSLQPLALDQRPWHPEPLQAYYRYYGIDFSQRYPQFEHHCGFIDAGRHHIVGHVWRAPDATATCFLVHGYFDHVGLYGRAIDYCLARGFNVVAWDLPGHGLSSGPRYSIDSFAEYGDVLDAMLTHCAALVRPWYGIGQSTGAAILMDHMLRSPAPQFSRQMLIAPLVRPVAWWWIRAALLVGGPFLKQVPRRFALNSHDAGFLDFLHDRDPLQWRAIPVAWVRALKIWLRSFVRLTPTPDMQPLVVQGPDDTTVDWRYNLGVIRQKFPRARVLLLQRGRHQLVNESA
ncbi:MAG TPA: alpha/beta hydrolase, partial [Spongiibacteraceae bacterium]|nr:alpha/beta hydrolase [Spongiibacteraceae bacterium]